MTMVRMPVTADTARRMPVLALLALVAGARGRRDPGSSAGLTVAPERGHAVHGLLGTDYPGHPSPVRRILAGLHHGAAGASGGRIPGQNRWGARGRTLNQRIKRSTLICNTRLTCNDAMRSLL
jgi:hypothetical protein